MYKVRAKSEAKARAKKPYTKFIQKHDKILKCSHVCFLNNGEIYKLIR